MLKRMMTLVLALSIFSVQAHAAGQTGLKAAFDELNYALNVEWDQKDKAFFDAQKEKFSAVVADLRANGLSNSELIDFVTSEIKDEKFARDVKATLNLISINNMSSSQAAEYMSEMMKNAYSQGANWNGGVSLLLLGAGVLLIVAAAAVGGYGGGGGYGGSYCYHDIYWGYTCSYDCYYYACY